MHKDYLYKVTFDNINFHIEKINIISTKQVKHYYIPILTLIDLRTGEYKCYEYSCGDGNTYRTDDIDNYYYHKNNIWICSSKEKCVDIINRFIHNKIDYCEYQIAKCTKDLKFWNNKLKIYEKSEEN